MLIRQIQDDAGWRKLLLYYMDCLREEHRLHHVIKAGDIQNTCWFLPRIDGSFLRNTSVFSISIQHKRETEVERLQRFVQGEQHSGKHPGICFGYPFFVDSHHNLVPLLYVDVSGQQTDRGVCLTSKSPEIEINLAALREILSDGEETARDQVRVRLDELEAESGRARFDQTLDLVTSHLEKSYGEPVARVGRKQFEPQQLPRQAVVECPLLFRVRAGDTNQLSRELGHLKERHDWSQVRPALRHLLTESDNEPYPEVPERAVDPRLYVVPASDSQRQAIAAAGQCPLTVITGPPEMNRSWLVLNIVGDAVLRGETVLVTSPNDETVDAVFERFLKLNYPGVVQSGEEFLRQMLPAMRRAFADVCGGGIVGRLEQVRGEYEEIVRQIDGQRDSVALIEQLEQDHKVCQREIKDLLKTLPESIRTAVKRDRIRAGQDNEQQLDAAIHALLEDVEKVIAQCQVLAEKVRAVLLDNQHDTPFLRELEDVEQRLGISISLRRPSVDLGSFSAIEAYISAWENLLQVLLLEDHVQQLQAKVGNAERQAQSQREGLPASLSADLGDAARTFDEQREHSLRPSLKAIESEARAATLQYRQLVLEIDDLRKRSAVVAHWLLGATTMLEGDDSATWRLENILDQGFAIKDDVLNVHRLGTAQADLGKLLNLLRQDRANKIVEFQDLLARLEEGFVAARTRVPALLLPKIEAALEVADHETWQNLAVQLEELNTWTTRIDAGKLTPGEQLRRIVFRGWAVKQLRGELGALAISNAALFALRPVEEPPRAVSFRLWAEYVHTWNSFAQACAIAARRAFVQQAFVSYRAQSESEINARSAELEEIKPKFAELFTQLPKAIAGAMSGNAWPFEAIDATIVRDLDVLREQYRTLKAQYADWAERLAALQQNRTLPEVLQTSWITPLAVSDLVSAWLQFSQAAEAECELNQLRSSLAETESSPDALWAKLPDGMRQELDWSKVLYSDDLFQPLQQYMSDLRLEMAPQIEEWNRTQGRAIALLHQNEAKSHALGRLLKKAHKDPSYLSELLVETYEHPEQLLDDLRIWQQVIQVWRLRTQRTRVREKLKGYSSRDQAQLALGELLERRRALAGQVLMEQWRHVATELEPDTVRSIDQYLSAIELLAEGKADFVELKQQAEAHFDDALKLFPVWLTPNLSTQDIPLKAGLFDCVVIDEASQCDIPSALPLLFRARRIVVIGDERPPAHVATLADSVNQQLFERHDIGIGTNYDYKLYSLFDLASNSVTGGPGQIRAVQF